MLRASFASLFLGTAAVVGCATGSVDDGTTDPTSTSSADASSTSGVGGAAASTSTSSASSSTTTGGSGGGGGSSGPVDCGPTEGLIYLVSKANDLYRYEPKAGVATKIGPIMCQVATGVTPFSIAIDRKDQAWMLYSDGRLYQVSTASAACATTAFFPSQQGFKTFSMAFVSSTPGSSDETLAIANTTGVGRIDLATLKVSAQGTYSVATQPLVTGSAKSEFFGFFPGASPYLATIDVNTAALGAHEKLSTLKASSSNAFAYWGGRVWFFTTPIGTSSRIDRYDPVSKTAELINIGIGFEVVAAGVSTCAPTTL